MKTEGFTGLRENEIALIKTSGVVCIFAVAGAGVSRMAELLFKVWNFHVGVVFALICWLLFWRSLRILLVAPLVVLIWLAAFWVTFLIAAGNGLGLTATLVSVLVGGAVGGAGLGICDSIYSKRMAPRGWVVSTLIGCVAALPFWAWNTVYVSSLNGGDKSNEQALLTIAFAVWWGVMGAYLYASSRALFPKLLSVVTSESLET